VSDPRIELASRAVDAWNRRDLRWLQENGTADIEFVPAIAATVDGSSVHGPEEFIRFLEAMDESWESFRIEVEEFRLIGDQVVGRGRVLAKGRGSGVELDQPLGSLISFEGDKMSRLQSYLDPEEALAAAQSGKEGTA
jgi:ketosteroid isomerase-like protein